MTGTKSTGTAERDRGRSPAPQPRQQQPARPWRTEGMPDGGAGGDGGRGAPRRRWWVLILQVLVGYVVVFGLLSVQDQMGGPQPVPYTEFRDQVEAGNVDEVFARGDSIQGVLAQPAPLPEEEAPTSSSRRSAPRSPRTTC